VSVATIAGRFVIDADDDHDCSWRSCAPSVRRQSGDLALKVRAQRYPVSHSRPTLQLPKRKWRVPDTDSGWTWYRGPANVVPVVETTDITRRCQRMPLRHKLFAGNGAYSTGASSVAPIRTVRGCCGHLQQEHHYSRGHRPYARRETSQRGPQDTRQNSSGWPSSVAYARSHMWWETVCGTCAFRRSRVAARRPQSTDRGRLSDEAAQVRKPRRNAQEMQLAGLGPISKGHRLLPS
jgi:hypothetical protein